MTEITCSLLADGSSDAALVPILKWVVQQYVDPMIVQCQLADLSRLPSPPRSLPEKILKAIELYPCQILFVHRDAEKQSWRERKREIEQAISEAQGKGFHLPAVCVIPIRMTEAWLLLDESAIRRAAGNPHGTISISLPAAKRIEKISDPKKKLFDCLEKASGRKGRRLKKFDPARYTRLVTENMQDFRRLRELSAFKRLEQDAQGTIATIIS